LPLNRKQTLSKGKGNELRKPKGKAQWGWIQGFGTHRGEYVPVPNIKPWVSGLVAERAGLNPEETGRLTRRACSSVW
jgi:hypothetical protein